MIDVLDIDDDLDTSSMGDYSRGLDISPGSLFRTDSEFSMNGVEPTPIVKDLNKPTALKSTVRKQLLRRKSWQMKSTSSPVTGRRAEFRRQASDSTLLRPKAAPLQESAAPTPPEPESVEAMAKTKLAPSDHLNSRGRDAGLDVLREMHKLYYSHTVPQLDEESHGGGITSPGPEKLFQTRASYSREVEPTTGDYNRWADGKVDGIPTDLNMVSPCSITDHRPDSVAASDIGYVAEGDEKEGLVFVARGESSASCRSSIRESVKDGMRARQGQLVLQTSNSSDKERLRQDGIDAELQAGDERAIDRLDSISCKSASSQGSPQSLCSSVVAEMPSDMGEPLLSSMEKQLMMKKRPFLRNDTNAYILAPPEFRISKE